MTSTRTGTSPHHGAEVVPLHPAAAGTTSLKEGARSLRSAVSHLAVLARRLGLENTAMTLDLAMTALEVDLDHRRKQSAIAAE